MRTDKTGVIEITLQVQYCSTTTLRRAIESLKLEHGTRVLNEEIWHFLLEENPLDNPHQTIY
eukprot:1095938-Rhodomonas_salina.1